MCVKCNKKQLSNKDYIHQTTYYFDWDEELSYEKKFEHQLTEIDKILYGIN